MPCLPCRSCSVLVEGSCDSAVKDRQLETPCQSSSRQLPTEVHRAQIQLGVDGQDPLRGEGYTGEQVQRKYGLWRREPSLQEKNRDGGKKLTRAYLESKSAGC